MDSNGAYAVFFTANDWYAAVYQLFSAPPQAKE